MKQNKQYDIDEICQNCEHSAVLSDDDNVLCAKKGIVSKGYKCGKFVLDVMRIDPKRPKLTDTLEYVDIDKTDD